MQSKPDNLKWHKPTLWLLYLFSTQVIAFSSLAYKGYLLFMYALTESFLKPRGPGAVLLEGIVHWAHGSYRR